MPVETRCCVFTYTCLRDASLLTEDTPLNFPAQLSRHDRRDYRSELKLSFPYLLFHLIMILV